MFDLNLPAEFVLPDYAGGSIANVPATIAQMLDVPFQGLPPLRPELWQGMKKPTKRVVLLVLDAFGWNLVEGNRFLQPWLNRAAVVGQITSIFPSTTVAALSSLWTGYAPAQHGMVGLNLLFPEYGTIAQMLSLSPTFRRYPDALVDAGTKPEEFLAVSGFAEQLAQANIPTYAFKGHDIVNSALSKMHGRGVKGSYGVFTFADMLVQLRQLLEQTAGEPLYVNAYYPTIDTLSHFFTPFHAAVQAELQMMFDLLDRELWQALSPQARQDTVLFIVADHGQTPTPNDRRIYLDHHPQLHQLLLMRPAGEPRTAYFYARQGQQQAVLDYVQEQLPEIAAGMPALTALQTNLFGPFPHSPQVPNRLGDVILTMRHGHALSTLAEKEREKRFIGLHGGLTRNEMLVPWLGFQL